MESPIRGPLPADLKLIETFGWRKAGFVNLPEHLARLERTARTLGIRYDPAAVARELERHAGGEQPLRVRLTVALDGAVAVETAPLAPGPEIWRLRIADERLDSADPWLRLKTSRRERYDRARAALAPGVDEAIFLNERGELCEGTIFNLFLKVDGTCLTPPVESGLLPGVLREILLRRGEARTAVLRPDDLPRGQLFVGNSLRGLCPARLV